MCHTFFEVRKMTHPNLNVDISKLGASLLDACVNISMSIPSILHHSTSDLIAACLKGANGWSTNQHKTKA